MQKVFSILLTMCLIFGLCACSHSEQTPAEMYIEPAQLTQEEKNVADLLGLNTGQRIFDFVVDDSVQTIRVNTYRLIDGKWALEAGGGGQAFTDKTGRLALSFDKLAEGIRIAIQSAHSNGSTSYQSEPEENLIGMGYATSILSEKTEIAYETEIPLAIQVVTNQNEIVSYQVDYFAQPEEYEKLGYEGVFAVTIYFSQKPLS